MNLLTRDEIKDALTKAVRTEGLIWSGFEQDKDCLYTIPFMSPMHHSLAQVVQDAFVQKNAKLVPVFPSTRRTVMDAIRAAYDQGYEDARNAKATPGDNAPGYNGRNAEQNQGETLLRALTASACLHKSNQDCAEAQAMTSQLKALESELKRLKNHLHQIQIAATEEITYLLGQDELNLLQSRLFKVKLQTDLALVEHKGETSGIDN